MEATTAMAGFEVEQTSSGWGHLVHEACGQWTSFVDPTEARIRWHVATHRCGPDGTEWHLSEPMRDAHRSESPGATAAWMRSVSRYVGTRPTELLTNQVVWPALQELATTIADRFPSAFDGEGR